MIGDQESWMALVYDSKYHIPSIRIVLASIVGTCISLLFFNKKSTKLLLKSVKERWKLCAFNLTLAYFWCAFVCYFKRNCVSFSNDNWEAPKNDTLLLFILHLLWIDMFIYCGHYILHNNITLRPYHYMYHHHLKSPFAFDSWYVHPIDNFVEFLIPYFMAVLWSNISYELVSHFLFFEILFNVFAHQTELNFDHIKHHQSASHISFGIGLFMDPMLGSSSYSLVSQINHILILPLIYYGLKLQSPPVLYIFILFLSFSLYRNATQIQLFETKNVLQSICSKKETMTHVN
eukprot:434696_1